MGFLTCDFRDLRGPSMAARVATSSVDFVALATKIPSKQRNALMALKGKVEGHQRKVNSLPASLPAIDFSVYQSKITVAGMVDNFEKSYAALSIPYPADQGTIAAIDEQAAGEKVRYDEFVVESKADCRSHRRDRQVGVHLACGGDEH